MEKNSITVIDFLQSITIRVNKPQKIKIMGYSKEYQECPYKMSRKWTILWEGEYKGYNLYLAGLPAIGTFGKQYFKDNLDFAYACVAIVQDWSIIDNEIVIYTYSNE